MNGLTLHDLLASRLEEVTDTWAFGMALELQGAAKLLLDLRWELRQDLLIDVLLLVRPFPAAAAAAAGGSLPLPQILQLGS